MTEQKEPEEIQQILDQVAKLTEEYIQVMERTQYVILLSQTLVTLRNNIGGLVEDYYNQFPNARALAIDFTHGEEGFSLFKLFETVFSILNHSENYYGHEYRNIEGISLDEVDGIDISALGINTIVPKSLENTERFQSVITLKQIDDLRIGELHSVGGMAYEDESKIHLVKGLIRESGGIPVESIF